MDGNDGEGGGVGGTQQGFSFAPSPSVQGQKGAGLYPSLQFQRWVPAHLGWIWWPHEV